MSAMNREPLRVKALRKKAALAPESDLGVVMAYADLLRDEIERLELPPELPDARIVEVAGPATDEIGGKDVWTLGRKDLVRLAHGILQAAIRERADRG
jgi:hypothetical protein